MPAPPATCTSPSCRRWPPELHHAALGDELLDLKISALAAHATQTAELIDRVGGARYREWWRYESFRRAGASRHLHIAELPALAA